MACIRVREMKNNHASIPAASPEAGARAGSPPPSPPVVRRRRRSTATSVQYAGTSKDGLPLFTKQRVVRVVS